MDIKKISIIGIVLTALISLLLVSRIPVQGKSLVGDISNTPVEQTTPIRRTTRVSVGDMCVEGNGDSSLYDIPALSGTGRFVTFMSAASNLVSIDLNNAKDIFVHDRQSGQTDIVSVNTAGFPGNDDSVSPDISDDGRFVVFKSDASNLVIGDTNNKSDIFIHDRSTGETELISNGLDGHPADCYSGSPSISFDGRFITFHSCASNLVENDENGTYDIFVYDTLTESTELVSKSSISVPGNNQSTEPAISSDGNFVAYHSLANNLVEGDTNGAYDIFLHDLTTGSTIRVSRNSQGEQGNNHSGLPSLSSDGSYITYHSYADNLVPDDNNLFVDVFLFNRISGETEIISVNSQNIQGDNESSVSSISADGNLVVFKSKSTNLVTDDTNAVMDIFIRDRSSGNTRRVSISSTGLEANQDSEDPVISGDGSSTAFWSISATLVSNDLNGAVDVFVNSVSDGDSSYTISGEVLTGELQPLPGVTVWTGSCLNAISDEMGNYTITEVYTGTYTLSASLPGFAFDPDNRIVNIPPNSIEQDFVAITTHSISGMILDELSQPLPDVTICTDQGHCTQTLGDGSYTLIGITSGTYLIVPGKMDYYFTPEYRSITVPPDGTGVDFTAEYNAYTITGTTIDTTGSPISSVSISINTGQTAISTEDGTFALTGLTGGYYSVIPLSDQIIFHPSAIPVIIPPSGEGLQFVGALRSSMIFLPMIANDAGS